MKEILIIEDKEIERETLKNIILEIDPCAVVYEAENETEAYGIAMKTTIDVFLVDIILHPECLGDKAGVEFAQNIRTVERYRFTPIIIVTSLYDERMSVFTAIRYYSFIEKPFHFEKVKKTISEAMCYQTKNDIDKKYVFHADGLLHSVNIRDICYIESRYHQLNMVTRRETYNVPYKTCKTMLEELDAPEFIQCNRGTIINVKRVRKVDFNKRLIYFDDVEECVEIGPVMKKAFLEEFMDRVK